MDPDTYEEKIGEPFEKHENPGVEANTDGVSTQWEVTQLQHEHKRKAKLYREQRAVEQALRN